MLVHTALNRFGLGARPGEAASLGDPRAWLDAQVQRTPAPLPHEVELPDTDAVVAALLRQRATSMDGKARRQEDQARLKADLAAWWQTRRDTPHPFFHRWAAFWGNHLTVSVARRQVMPLWGVFQRDAIRPHVLGPFEDLLLASTRHPAMLLYLDNAGSVGPSSRAGQRRDRGLNENLAREILELHTLGVDGGYTQDDVLGLARVLTGWSVPRKSDEVHEHGFRFRQGAHEPGSKTLLGRPVPSGRNGGLEALRMLARHPSTRRHLCRKIATHFVADDPPDVLVAHLEAAWQDSSGHLGTVARALVDHPAAADPTLRKVKTPQDLVTSVARALPEARTRDPDGPARALGQPAALVPSPAGWDDDAASWLGPEGMLGRIDLAVQAAGKAHLTAPPPASLARDLLGPSASPDLLDTLAANNPRRALILLLASPPFQRR